MGIIASLRAALGTTKANAVSDSAIVRAGQSLGPWTDTLGGFISREVNPYFYESLREAIAPLDGAINRLVTLDGIIGVDGGNDRVVQLIERELLPNIAVNDLESGLQAFYAGQGNEVYEQGFTVGEMVMDARRGRELVGLRIADSKGVVFVRDPDTLQLQTWYRPPSPKRGSRRDGSDQVETVLRNNGTTTGTSYLTQANYVRLDDAALVYASLNPEADKPYGVSLFRSMEFVAQILLKIQNATGQVWDRFGDPPMQLVYTTKNRTLKAADLDKRRTLLGKMLADVMSAKRGGNSADFVQAIAADDDIEIKVIGTEGKVLSLEVPARHMMEQILAKAGLPAWMLGMQWSTAERMADQQSEIVLQEARTRFTRRKAGLRRIVETWLRGRGVAWKPGDWDVVQTLPRLQDAMKEAQARFLNAQADMMGSGGAPGTAPAPADPGAKGYVFHAEHDGTLRMVPRQRVAHTCGHRKGAEGGGEDWAEPDPALPRIEQAAVDGLLQLWRALEAETLRVLNLSGALEGGAQVFTFDVAAVARRLADMEEAFVAAAGAEDGPLLREAFKAWVRGLENAATELNTAAVVGEARTLAQRTLATRGMDLVRNAAVRSMRSDIVAELSQGAYDGLNPREVARQLRARFAVHDYDWERLARSEIADAQAQGKAAQYAAAGLTEYDWLTAPGACALCVGIAEAGPYTIGAGPMPMRGSHPHCRCTITARAPA